jgi:FAD/FMN-containing dehydrogenase
MIDTRQELVKSFGARNVLDDPSILESYSRDESFAHALKPWYVVKPQTAAQIQEIVRWANRTSTPLVPVSSGPPHFRGDTIPSVPGSVVVDLSGMKKIFSIDRRNRIASIEPGVTYGELQPALAKEGLRLSTPLLPRTTKSVVGSLLERDPVLVTRNQWVALDPLRATEIVWGDGERFRTGDAANWPSLEIAMEKGQSGLSGAGPVQTDFYRLTSAAQGTMGIVTFASIKCDVLPVVHKLCFAPSQNLNGLLDFVYKVLKFRFGNEVLILNNMSLASLLAEESPGIEKLRNELPPWVAVIGITGGSILPEERAASMEKDIAEFASQFGLSLNPAIKGVNDNTIKKAILGPSRDPYWKAGYKGSFQEIFFVTTLDRTPDYCRTMFAVAEARGYPVADIGVYIQPLHQGVNVHCEFILPYNGANSAEVSRMKDIYTTASEELINQRAYFSRPYGIWANMVYNRDAQSTIVLRKLKGIFDPNNIMNPGKLCF